MTIMRTLIKFNSSYLIYICTYKYYICMSNMLYYKSYTIKKIAAIYIEIFAQKLLKTLYKQ